MSGIFSEKIIHTKELIESYLFQNSYILDVYKLKDFLDDVMETEYEWDYEIITSNRMFKLFIEQNDIKYEFKLTL